MKSRPGKAQRRKSLTVIEAGHRDVGIMRRLLMALSLAITLNAFSAIGSTVSMQSVTDLRQEAQTLRAENLVLVLEFASDDCPYCRKLEALFLLPMQRNASYDSKILIRAISMSDNDTVIGFDGESMTTSEFAAGYEVTVTPTLLFLSADGSEMSERLVGIWSEDFYGGFIDARIDAAIEKL